MSRSTSVSACTAPKDFVTPRNCTSGARTPSGSALSSALVTPPRVRPAPPHGEGRATAWSTPRTLCDRPKTGLRTPLLWSDSRSLAISGERPGAQLRCRHELILDDGRVHVLRRDPCGSQEDRWNRCAAHRVGGLSIGQTRRRRLSGSQVQGERRGGLCFQIDGLVGGPALVSRQYVVQPGQRGVLPRGGERLGCHVERLQVRDYRGTGLVVGNQGRIDVRVSRVGLLELGFSGRWVPGVGCVGDVGPLLGLEERLEHGIVALGEQGGVVVGGSPV